MLGQRFSLDCFVFITDQDLRNSHKILLRQEKMSKVVTQNNISAVFGSLERKSFCGYFILLNNITNIVSQISKTVPHSFEEFSWFIQTRDEVSNIGLRLQLNTDIKIIRFPQNEGEIFEVYGVGGQKIRRKIADVRTTKDGQNLELVNV